MAGRPLVAGGLREASGTMNEWITLTFVPVCKQCGKNPHIAWISGKTRTYWCRECLHNIYKGEPRWPMSENGRWKTLFPGHK